MEFLISKFHKIEKFLSKLSPHKNIFTTIENKKQSTGFSVLLNRLLLLLCFVLEREDSKHTNKKRVKSRPGPVSRH